MRAIWCSGLPYLRVFGRGMMIVTLTASNIRQIAAGHYGRAFCVGMAISAVWWWNARTAGHDERRGLWLAYAFGAGVGTVTGMWLAR